MLVVEFPQQIQHAPVAGGPRGAVGAEPEIRKLAGAVLDVLRHEAPNLFGDYRKVPLPDGTYELVTDFKKV